MITSSPQFIPTVSTEKYLKDLVAQYPKDTEAKRKLARFWFVEGKIQDAAELYAQILKVHQHDYESLSFLAHLYLERGIADHAVALFNAMLAIKPHDKAARYHLSAMSALLERGKTTDKYAALYEKMIGTDDQCPALGLSRENIPVLIEMNGDLLWLPGDLLRFLWHTVRKPLTTPVPSFLAETDHYVWVRDRIKPGDDVLDIGSNLGIFATMMGARVGTGGRVFAFEPSARIASDLRRVLALNELKQVTVTEAAVSNQNGEATFCDIEESDVRREGSHLSDELFDRVTSEHQQKKVVVKTVVLDDFVAGHNLRPSVIKIDVEGAEHLVLAGAEKTIAAYKPKLVIEIHPKTKDGPLDPGPLLEYLKRFGYEHKSESKTYYCW